MNSLRFSLTLIVVVTIVKFVGGILAGSLALLADAGHGLTLGVSLGLALLATRSEASAATVERTFGYHRAEILASLANALVLWVIAGWVLLEAYQRLTQGAEVQAGLMVAIATSGLVAHIVVARMLNRPAREHAGVVQAQRLAKEGVLASVAAVAAGALVLLLGMQFWDAAFGAVIGIMALVSTWRLLAHVVHVLLEGTPEHIDIYRLCSRIEDLPGVTLIHDVHVWTLTPGYDALTAHVMVEPEQRGEMEALLGRIRTIAYEEFNIRHVTVQLETTAANCREDHHVDHLVATARPPA